MQATFFFTTALAFFFTAASAQPFDDMRITASAANDSMVRLEIIEVGAKLPANALKYPAMSKSEAREIVNFLVEEKARARAAAQYALLLAQQREERVLSDAKALGVLDLDQWLKSRVLPTFEGRWRFKAPGQPGRELFVSKDGKIKGAEPGQIIAHSSFELELQSGGASMKFVSQNGKNFAAQFGADFYLLDRLIYDSSSKLHE
ncbi:hypothetical protein KC887_00730 [Candidatus Kaiserbacteria bacterium]|nr:hypothetical protein [Candidatus Kaiserbacteria bacterium]